MTTLSLRSKPHVTLAGSTWYPGRRVKAAGGASLTPEEIFSGIVTWWAMDLGFSAVSGRMASVDEQVSGAANDQLVQATAGNRPYVVASDANFGDRQVINANGAAPGNPGHTLCLKTSADTNFGAQPYTTIVVGRRETNGSGDYYGELISAGATGPVYAIEYSGGNCRVCTDANYPVVTAWSTLAFALKVTWNGTSTTAYFRWKDGTTYQSGGLLTYGTSNWEGMGVLNFASDPQYGFPGAIADVILVAGAPSQDEWDLFDAEWLVKRMGWDPVA